jgi:hypothetical protein
MSVAIEFVMAGSGPAARNLVLQLPTFWQRMETLDARPMAGHEG